MEADINLNEFGDPIADLWRTTVFSTQTTYEKTVRIAGASCVFLLLIAAGVIAGFQFFNEECPFGFHE